MAIKEIFYGKDAIRFSVKNELKNPQKIKPNSQEELTISWKEEDDDVTADIR